MRGEVLEADEISEAEEEKGPRTLKRVFYLDCGSEIYPRCVESLRNY